MTFVDHVAGTVPRAEPDTLAAALDDTRAFIASYVHITPEQAALITVWAAMTHVFGAFPYVAYLHISSPQPECGKSRLLEVLETLVAKPWFTGRVSAAVLMRKVDRIHPTLLLDESDAAFGGDEQYAEALRGMLNSGFHETGKASVCIGQGANLTDKDFSVFGPKAIAGIGKLPNTVESRSIPIIMERKHRGEAIRRWRHEGRREGPILRERLIGTSAPFLEAFRELVPVCPEGLSDRAEDVLEPLFAIADVAGGEWPEAVRSAAVALMGVARAAREAEANLPLELLGDIREIFDAHPEANVLASKVILEALHALEDRPWPTFGRSEKPITANKVARLLNTFGIKPAGQLWIEGRNCKGYRRAAFENAFARYLGSKPLERSNPNKTGPEVPETDPLGASGPSGWKTAKTPDEYWCSSDLAPVSPDHGDVPASALHPATKDEFEV